MKEREKLKDREREKEIEVEKEESSHPYVQCEVPKELFLHIDQLMPHHLLKFGRELL